MSDRLAHMSDGAFSLVAAHFYILVSIKAALYTLVCQFSSADHSFSFSSLTTYTERKKKRRVEFFPSYFNHFLRSLL